MTKNYLFALLSIFFLLSFTFISPDDKESNSNFYTQGDNNRTAAEWEPAKGTLIVWPLSIPYKLVVELAKDNHLYTMLEDKEIEKEAKNWYTKWGIDLSDVTFIYAEQGIDAWWTRDWGPSAVFNPKGMMSLGDGKYQYSTPVTDLPCNDTLLFLFYDENNELILTQTDDDATSPLADQLGIPLLDLPFANTGGNVLSDGIGTAFSSCVLLTENEYRNVEPDAFFNLNDSLLGFEEYHILSNFEHYGIQHIDCLMKLIDEETILVAEPPKDHPLYPIYENIVNNELKRLRSPYGRPYEIKRLPTAPYMENDLAAYTNSLILNNVVYVPLFNIDHDNIALATWKEVMPGYEIKGFSFSMEKEPIMSKEMWDHYNKYGKYGWNSGDALHCRTRAIWDDEMLFISVKRPRKNEKGNKGEVCVSMIDYSQQGINKSRLFWREEGQKEWKEISLRAEGDPQHGRAYFPAMLDDKRIEYYIEAETNSGKIARRPSSAPAGFYTY